MFLDGGSVVHQFLFLPWNPFFALWFLKALDLDRSFLETTVNPPPDRNRLTCQVVDVQRTDVCVPVATTVLETQGDFTSFLVGHQRHRTGRRTVNGDPITHWSVAGMNTLVQTSPLGHPPKG